MTVQPSTPGGLRPAQRAAARTPKVPSEVYADEVTAYLREELLARMRRISKAGMTLPEPSVLAGLMALNLPDVPDGLDRHVDVAPFYDSTGARRQLRDITRQALAGRPTTGAVLAMRTGDGAWLYPAWQFTGDGRVHQALVPTLRALRACDGWVAGVWLTSPHPDLDGLSPRQALREGADTEVVADLARNDMANLAA